MIKFLRHFWTNYKDLLFLVLIFILIRSLHFDDFYSFANDQSLLTFRAMRSFVTDRFTLIGPFIGLGSEGRNLILPSTTYYLILFFTFLARGDVLWGSYLFMIFAGISIVFLYHGAKKLGGIQVARLVCVVYALLPYYIFYTRDNFNPNFFLIFTPYLVYFYALASTEGKKYAYFASGVTIGFLTQLHTQIGLIYIFLLIMSPFLVKKHKSNFFWIIPGLIIGLLPFILIELNNNFYNFRTLFMSLKQPSKDVATSTNLSQVDYIYTGVSLFFGTILISKFKKFITPRLLTIVSLFLAVYSLGLLYPAPGHSQGVMHDWYYRDNEQVAKIIREQKLTSYNVSLPFHQNTGESVKFFLVRDGENIAWDDYYNNQYLFLVTDGSDIASYKTYEVNDFRPFKILKTWEMRNQYRLYLLERIKTDSFQK